MFFSLRFLFNSPFNFCSLDACNDNKLDADRRCKERRLKHHQPYKLLFETNLNIENAKLLLQHLINDISKILLSRRIHLCILFIVRFTVMLVFAAE